MLIIVLACGDESWTLAVVGLGAWLIAALDFGTTGPKSLRRPRACEPLPAQRMDCHLRLVSTLDQPGGDDWVRDPALEEQFRQLERVEMMSRELLREVVRLREGGLRMPAWIEGCRSFAMGQATVVRTLARMQSTLEEASAELVSSSGAAGRPLLQVLSGGAGSPARIDEHS